MKKYIVLGTVGLFALLGVGTAVVLGINAYDPPLAPEVAKILEEKPQFTEKERQGFFYIVGLQAGEATDPLKKGEEIYNHYMSLKPEERSAYWTLETSKAKPWEIKFTDCKGEHHRCDIAYVNEHPEAAEALKEEPEALEHYYQLLKIGGVADLLEDEFANRPFNAHIFSYKLHRKMQLQLAVWVHEGQVQKALDLVELSNRFYKEQMLSGNLLGRSIGAVEMRGNATFLAELRKVQPKLHLKKSLVESFSAPDVETIMQGAVRTELRLSAGLTRDPSLFLASGNPEEDKKLKRKVFARILSLLNRPNETINKLYEANAVNLSSACDGEKNNYVEECMYFAWSLPQSRLAYVVNPVGRALVKSLQFRGYRQKLIINLQKISESKSDFTKMI